MYFHIIDVLFPYISTIFLLAIRAGEEWIIIEVTHLLHILRTVYIKDLSWIHWVGLKLYLMVVSHLTVQVLVVYELHIYVMLIDSLMRHIGSNG